MSNKPYSEVKIYIAGIGESSEHIYIKTNTLEGEKGIIELALEEEGDEEHKSLGYFNADQIIEAIRILKDANLDYTPCDKESV